MKLPHADQATIEIAKLRDYSLNPLHPEGKQKAQSSQQLWASPRRTLNNCA